MRLDLSKFKFFSQLNARARMFVLLGGVIGMIFTVYLGTKLISGANKTTGPSRVANAPQGLQSVPGGQLTPEYYRALMQANTQAAQQAQISGGSALPTLINAGGGQGPQSCIICSDQSTNIKTYLDDWIKQGKVAPDVASFLEQLAGKNVSPDAFAAELDRLVKEGKLTPEQARLLLEQYKKQHTNKLLTDSSKLMDDMIKSGQLSLDVANQLLEAQKKNMSPSEYAAFLRRLVRQGKLAAAFAQRLLAQYTQQRAKEIIMQSIDALHQMVKQGQLTPDVEKELIPLEERMVALDVYASTLQKFVSAGKLTPASAAKILEEFQAQKAAIGTAESVNQLLEKAEAAAFQELSDLLKAGKISQEVASQLANLIRNNVSMPEFQAAIDQLVQQGKLTPEIAKLKIADYQLVKGLRELSSRLGALQDNNGSVADYVEVLKRAVQAGFLTPEQAANLMQEYAASVSKESPAASGATLGTDAFAKLQQQVQQNASIGPVLPSTNFAAAQEEGLQESAQDRKARLDDLANAMSGQAQQLISAWQPPMMEHKAGTPIVKTQKGSAASGRDQASSADDALGLGAGAIPLIKSGTIIFGVLDTAINSDYPDTPVMVTIVDGKYKGAKLLGKIQVAKNVAGQLDRVSLNFSLMNLDAWPKSKTVTAFAIDPDTARTVLASQVDYHYLKRFGAIMATSFLQGYSTAITNAGTTNFTTSGTSTTRPDISPANKIAVGLGQIGQTLGTVTQNYVNIPPTVKVDSGVGLGILFMADVT
jgi:type IV secretory pathway VirB10-like protein/polyhydroxyalkanoate synthesis regulator phasin